MYLCTYVHFFYILSLQQNNSHNKQKLKANEKDFIYACNAGSHTDCWCCK